MFDFICHEKFITQQVRPRSAIEIELSTNAWSTHCFEHSEVKLTATHPLPLMGLPITRHTSMRPSCIIHRKKLKKYEKETLDAKRTSQSELLSD